MKSIELNIEKALGTVSKSDVFALEDKAKSGMEMLHKGTGKGNDFLGWLNLPSEITEAHLADLEAAAKQLKDRCEIATSEPKLLSRLYPTHSNFFARNIKIRSCCLPDTTSAKTICLNCKPS